MAAPKVQHQSSNSLVAGSSRGKLDLVKCDFCRRDKQKCEPQPRHWPQKCVRCVEKRFRCSPSTRKQRNTAKRRFLLSSDTDMQTSVNAEAPLLRSDKHSNAVSFLKMLKRLVVKLDRWRKESVDVFHCPGDTDEAKLSHMAAAFRGAVQTLCHTLLGYVTARMTVLSTRKDERAASEASTLRMLACNIIERPHTGYSDEDYTLVNHSNDSVLNTTIESMVLNHEIGAALLLEDEYLAKRISTSHNDDPPNDFMVFIHRFRKFCPVIKQLWDSRLAPAVHGDPASSMIDIFVKASIIDSNSPWIRKLVTKDSFWSLQDCLGYSILHGILEELGRGSFSLLPEEANHLFSNIGTHCVQHNRRDIYGRSVLHIATQYNVPVAVQALLQSGVSPDDCTYTGSLPLHYAAALGHVEICETLLMRTKKLTCLDQHHRTPLDYALRVGNRDIVRLFLDHGGENIMHDGVLMAGVKWSGRSGTIYEEVLNWYRRNTPPCYSDPILRAMHYRDQSGDTAIHIAVRLGNLEAVKHLAEGSKTLLCGISAEPLINCMNAQGETALCLAVKKGPDENWVPMIKTLLCVYQINTSIPDIHSKTPLDYARSHSKFLGDVGFDVWRMLKHHPYEPLMSIEGDVRTWMLETTT
ncbi:ankyrin repeat-containing domain protein [Apiosordaria backusii]|uniref:Ankyrin repeat-containing domain protein n=1 Tax=Apiosordaria backusii TaxID=314023 RepID=A0AA40K3T9_9PEZI|nr:ankyrin repeat-containing domain protein [Apiosordaria backusii]